MPDHTFENFIPGNNVFAFEAVRTVAARPGKYNPLLLCGPSGSGKTHMVEGLIAYLRENNPEKKIIHWTAEAYVSTFIHIVRNQSHASLMKFKKNNRSADLFILENFDFLCEGNKNSTLQEFFQAFDMLFTHQKQIIITSNKSPKEMRLPERYSSRLAMGLICQMQEPDAATREKILLQACKSRDIRLTSEVLQYLSEYILHAGALIGAVNKLQIYLRMEKKSSEELSIKEVHTLVQDLIRKENVDITADVIVKTVADFYGIRAADIKGKSRATEDVLARQVAIYIVSTLMPELSVKQIGEAVNRDHSTIVHSLEQTKNKMRCEEFSGLKNTVDHLIRKITSFAE